MLPNRPDLSKLDPQTRAYIEALEAQIEHLQQPAHRPERLQKPSHRPERKPRPQAPVEDDLPFDTSEPFEPSEPPTTINLFIATPSGIVRRAPRHLFNRQRRGGMGAIEFESNDNEMPTLLALADERQNLLALTSLGRAHRLPVSQIPESTDRTGVSATARLNLAENEQFAALVPEQAQGYLAIVSQSGMVRMLRHHVFGEYMKPGMPLYDFKSFGPLAAACWTPGDRDLFIATRQGRAIRFSEKLVPPQGGPGVRLGAGDVVVGIAPVDDSSAVFLLSEDGRGTLRLMEGFTPNKAAGAGGKFAITTDRLICALGSDETEDVFILTRLGKLIRFRREEIPSKDGVVQGVVCISLRADQPIAAVLSTK
jgi:DNA gyrase subunit A